MRNCRLAPSYTVRAAATLAVLLTSVLLVPGASASVSVKSGSRAGAHSNVSVEVSGQTLKLKRVRRLNIDFPEGLSFNTHVGRSNCRPTAYLRGECNGGLTIGRVSLSVRYRGRSHRFNGSLRLLRTGRGMIATYAATIRLPASLGMKPRVLRLTDRVRLRSSDNGINHSFGDIYRDLSGFGRQIESLKVEFKGRVGTGAKAKTLVTNPTRCDGAMFRVAATTWAGYFAPIQKLRTYGGCNALPFNPRFGFAADSGARRMATGFTASFGVPYAEPDAQSAQIRRAELRMPVGARWNDGAIGAVGVCSAAESAVWNCPAGSRLGTAAVEVAGADLSGDVYLVERTRSVARFRAFVRSESNAKLTIDGSLDVDGMPGEERPVMLVDDAAQLPLAARFRFTQPLLVNSRLCGDNVVDARFTSYSDAAADRMAVYGVTGCPSAPAPPRITAGPPDGGFVNYADVAFEFGSTDLLPDDPTTYECSDDGAAFAPCSSPTTSQGMGEGTFAFAVRAVRDSKASPATARSFTIDMTDPVVTIGQPAAGAFVADGTPALTSSVTESNPAVSTCSVDGSPFGPCNDELGALTDGSHAVTVRHTDKAGNVGSASRSFTVDTVAPAVSIAEPTAGDYTSDATPTLTFSVTDTNPQTSQCSVDGGAYVACASGASLAAQADGGHDVAVRHVDKAGNAATAVSAYTVDTVAPAVSVSQPVAGSYTSNSTPPVAYTVNDANQGATQCRVDGGAFEPCPSSTITLVDGGHSLTVRHTDLAGNVGVAASGFTVDTTAPVLSVTSPVAGQLYDGDPADLAFTLAEVNPGSTQCSIDNAPWSACSSALDLADGPHSLAVRHTDLAGNSALATRNFSVDGTSPTAQVLSPVDGHAYAGTPVPVSYAIGDANLDVTQCKLDTGPFGACPATLDLIDGSHTLTVRHTDAAGNVGTSAATFTVDGTQPTVSISAPAGGSVTADTTPAIEFSASDASTLTIQCAIDAVTPVECTSPFVADTLSEGVHNAQVVATDAVGNVATASTAFTVDATPPAATISSPTSGSWIVSTTASVNFAVSDATATTERCRVDAGPYVACTSPWATPTLTQGAHTVAVETTDAAGSVTVAGVEFSVDSIAPAVALTQPANGALTNDSSPSVEYSVTEANPAVTQCKLDADPWGACPAELPMLAEGTHLLTVRHTDAAGNVTTTTSTFVVDTISPLVTLTSPVDGTTYNTAIVPLSYSVTDANPGTTTCSVDAGAYGSCPPTLDLDDGSHTLTVRHVDAAGNAATTTATFTVDTASPIIDITSPVDGQVYDGDPIPLTWTNSKPHPGQTRCSLDGGSFTSCPSSLDLADGPHTVTVRHADNGGNVGLDTATFVVDSTSPAVAIVAPLNGQLYNGDPIVPDIAVTDANPGVSTCMLDSAPVDCADPLDLADGPHTFAVSHTDAAGNVGGASSTFAVDGTPPVVSIVAPVDGSVVTTTLPELMVVFTTSDASTTTATCAVNGDSPAPCTSGDTLTVPFGAAVVTVTVTDAAGNATSETTTFTLEPAGP